MNIINLIIASVEFTLAWIIFQQTIPSAAKDGKVCGIRLWFLAMALALFASGRFTDFMEDARSPMIYVFGHICLISYSYARYRQAVRTHGKPWENHT